MRVVVGVRVWADTVVKYAVSHFVEAGRKGRHSATYKVARGLSLACLSAFSSSAAPRETAEMERKGRLASIHHLLLVYPCRPSLPRPSHPATTKNGVPSRHTYISYGSSSACHRCLEEKRVFAISNNEPFLGLEMMD